MKKRMKQNKLRGLYAITPDEPDTAVLIAKVEAALKGGANLVQYRNKVVDHGTAKAQATALANLCRQYQVPLIINDYPELALAAGAQGVHLGEADASIAKARALLGEDAIIGVSCYNRIALAEAAQRIGADYAAFGACFPSATKPEAVKAELALFTQARQLGLPLVAIGGITLHNAAQPIAAGASAVAVIGALWNSENIEQTARQFTHLIHISSTTSLS